MSIEQKIADLLAESKKLQAEEIQEELISEEEFKTLAPWKLCALLNDAYESGYKDAKADIRDMLGVK